MILNLDNACLQDPAPQMMREAHNKEPFRMDYIIRFLLINIAACINKNHFCMLAVTKGLFRLHCFILWCHGM
jgi:hypothetical protein